MGSIESYETAAGKRYRVRYRTPGRAQTDKRGLKTKREAEAFLASVEVAKMRGEWVSPERSRVTVAEWAETWYAAQVQLKATTRSGYRYTLDSHVLPKWGVARLIEIQHADVQAWVTGLTDKYAPSTVRQIHLVLFGVMKYAVRDGRIVRNPCDDMRLPRIVKHRRGYLTHEQVRQLAIELGDYGDVARFLAYTGLRWGEMAALKVGRLNLVRRRLDVIEAVSEPRGALVWSTPKSHGRRSVPFPAFLEEPLELRCQRKQREDLVFMGPDGGVLRGNNFRKRFFEPAVERCMAADSEFPRITPHDLRHTAASLAVSAGANVKSVQRMLGQR